MNELNFGLVSYWPLQEQSGNRFDLTGCANTLTDMNTVTGNPGVSYPASQFTAATNEYLTIASNANLQTGDIDFTFNFWAYMDTKPATVSWLIKYSAAAGNYDYQIFYTSATDRWQMAVARAVDSAQIVTANTFGSAPLSTWQMVTGWHDATANTVNLSINAGTPDSQATGGALQAAGTANFYLGGFAAANNVNGRICEVGFWKRVLTSRERLWLYNKGKGRSFPFDGRPSIAQNGRFVTGFGMGARNLRNVSNVRV